MRRSSGPAVPVWAAILVAAVLAACGSGSDPGGGSGSPPVTEDGPAAGSDLAVTAASYDLAVGAPARFLVGLETADRRLVTFGTVTLRFAFAGTGKGERGEPGPPVEAGYLPVAGSEVPDPVPTAPQAVTASQARGVYSAQVAFDRPGFWEVLATAVVGGRTLRGTGAFPVQEAHQVPAPGDQARPTENLTLSAPPELLKAVDSRGGQGQVPDPGLHRSTIAAALAARRPVVAVFSTPVYCTSRFCGPVTDVVEELSRQYADRATFVHVEVWRDFQGQVVNRAAAEWLMTDAGLTEPWVYVIGADGRVAARFDNVVTRQELEPRLRDLPVIGPAATG